MNERLDALHTRLARWAIALAVCVLGPTDTAEAQSSGGGYTLRKHVIGAGGMAQGSPYRLTATVAQVGAGVTAGASYVLIAGFHKPDGPTGWSDRIFCNGFENASCPFPPGVLP